MNNVSSSFRDPSGFIFTHDDLLYRQVNEVYAEAYRYLMDSGLYANLTSSGLLIRHQEVDISYAETEDVHIIIRPEPIPFVSYPYEWSFSQLKDAALTTLAIQKVALEFGMTLKDCSAYNIQFKDGRPVLIDTLSFERYEDGDAWQGYRQFCEHFLAPLALMSYRDIRLGQLLRVHLDGIPLDLASSLLPLHARFNYRLLMHLFAHGASQKHYADGPTKGSKRRISKVGLMGIVDSLQSCIKKLTWKPEGTEWADYCESSNYSLSAQTHKMHLVSEFSHKTTPKQIWDLGANTGLYSQLTNVAEVQTISFDMDPSCVEISYLSCKRQGTTNILPLLIDLTNPSPGIGWENRERLTLWERSRANMIMALALIHHLAISNNLPLGMLAEFFGRICDSLIIEFIPKEDSNAQRLLATRRDIFPNYNQPEFEKEFGRLFVIEESAQIRDSLRTLYLMKRRTADG